ncbi:MAG: hypothetical protein EU518_01625, partial [Promethearchaeota archaeon]
KKIVLNTFSEISDEVKFFFNENQNQFYVVIFKDDTTNRYPSIFFVSKSLIETFEKLELKSKVISLGIFLGFIKHGHLNLSIEGAEFLDMKNLLPMKRKFNVNKNLERSILYGNDITKSMINTSFFDNISSLKEGDLVFIFNINDEFLCISKTRINGIELKNVEGNKIVFQNLIDKGYYFRKHQ